MMRSLNSFWAGSLGATINTGRGPAYRLLKAQILLKADIGGDREGWDDARIAEALEAALSRKKRDRPPMAPIFDGEAEAKLIALACSAPPEGHARWTMRLLEKKVVELGIVEAASDSTIHRVLKKTTSSRTAAATG